MALLQSTLKDNILHAFEEALKIKESSPGCPPNIPNKVADLLASAYDAYAQNVTPGPLKFATSPQKAALLSFFVQTNSTGYAPGILAYWTPVTFAGPGLIPVNPILPASLATLSGLIAPKISTMIKKQADSVDAAASELASIFHQATMSLKVLTTTTSVPPVVLLVPFA